MIRVTIEILPSITGERHTVRVLDISNIGVDGFSCEAVGTHDCHKRKGTISNPLQKRLPIWEIVRRAIDALKLDREPL